MDMDMREYWSIVGFLTYRTNEEAPVVRISESQSLSHPTCRRGHMIHGQPNQSKTAISFRYDIFVEHRGVLGTGAFTAQLTSY